MADFAGLEARDGGVSVSVRKFVGTALVEVLKQLQSDSVASRLSGSDATLWGPAAESEASIRLGWVDLPTSSRALLPQLAELREEVARAGLDHVVLAGMGGSSLAPEVITRTYGVPLTVLDTTDPHQIRRAVADRLDRTVVVVSSKSGGTIETDSHRRAYEQAFRDMGLSDEELAQRIVVVTDPGSPLEHTAREAGYRVVLADPNVGGRYSALTAFGLVPSALAGVDVAKLLDEAAALSPELARNEATNPGLLLGAALGTGAVTGRDKAVIATATDAGGHGIVGFGDWAEQLIAESTGKEAKGILPVVVEGTGAPGYADIGEDGQRVVLGSDESADIAVGGPLGAQLLLWEFATAVAGRIIGIDPFDQPNVQESKDNTAALLEKAGDGPLPEGEPAFTDGAVQVFGDSAVLGGATTLAGALDALFGAVPERGYLAVMAYLDRVGEASAEKLRPAAAVKAGRQVTFGWAPRFLHSTGQFHKGGPPVGAFLQITGATAQDLDVPGRPYTFGRLQLAQALGDLGALTSRGRPALRLHLTDRAAGLRQLHSALGE
ncbi:glucose-6-phosphate isomerase [Wenjunlia tyrosinilytica]|uniref:Glucose-6-phosphate isomerase n=1 Tax=Wenjunlia tyrosinilytica TaxID=1544741 RepID=A0A918DTA2_9ACTN|nr:glucose-6-phosphate isomerase [Wenjunlia tyrosinilytica]GGO81420.1 glucose-6-phosphate isomerase [Wenjunlia tyrosinilytica]